jgi:hypothetical protein
MSSKVDRDKATDKVVRYPGVDKVEVDKTVKKVVYEKAMMKKKNKL